MALCPEKGKNLTQVEFGGKSGIELKEGDRNLSLPLFFPPQAIVCPCSHLNLLVTLLFESKALLGTCRFAVPCGSCTQV